MKPVTVGVLALQGCVQPHRPHIESLGMRFKEVRKEEDFAEIGGLILTGGESTTILKLLKTFSLEEKFQMSLQRLPVWGICAGAILMARQVFAPEQKAFGILDMAVERNSYGRQLDSFQTQIDQYPVLFIRAPKILSIGTQVKVVYEHDKNPVWVESEMKMATTFHPELTQAFPSPMHRRFGEWVAMNK